MTEEARSQNDPSGDGLEPSGTLDGDQFTQDLDSATQERDDLAADAEAAQEDVDPMSDAPQEPPLDAKTAAMTEDRKHESAGDDS